MCNKSYNGYTNYETWCVNLWIDNEEGSYNHVYAMASDVFESSEDSYNYSINFTKEENALNELEDQIKDYIKETNPLADNASLFSDLLGSALDNVNWREIAENWIEAVKENES